MVERRFSERGVFTREERRKGIGKKCGVLTMKKENVLTKKGGLTKRCGVLLWKLPTHNFS